MSHLYKVIKETAIKEDHTLDDSTPIFPHRHHYDKSGVYVMGATNEPILSKIEEDRIDLGRFNSSELFCSNPQDDDDESEEEEEEEPLDEESKETSKTAPETPEFEKKLPAVESTKTATEPLPTLKPPQPRKAPAAQLSMGEQSLMSLCNKMTKARYLPEPDVDDNATEDGSYFGYRPPPQGAATAAAAPPRPPTEDEAPEAPELSMHCSMGDRSLVELNNRLQRKKYLPLDDEVSKFSDRSLLTTSMSPEPKKPPPPTTRPDGWKQSKHVTAAQAAHSIRQANQQDQEPTSKNMQHATKEIKVAVDTRTDFKMADFEAKDAMMKDLKLDPQTNTGAPKVAPQTSSSTSSTATTTVVSNTKNQKVTTTTTTIRIPPKGRQPEQAAPVIRPTLHQQPLEPLMENPLDEEMEEVMAPVSKPTTKKRRWWQRRRKQKAN